MSKELGSFKICEKVEKILKGGLDSIPSPLPSVKIQIMSRKVCLRCKSKTFLDIITGLHYQQTFEYKKFFDITQQCFAANKLNFH